MRYGSAMGGLGRIFEDRERALTYVCEQPIVLEQRAFALGREVMTYLV